jgi:hypothetical protein
MEGPKRATAPAPTLPLTARVRAKRALARSDVFQNEAMPGWHSCSRHFAFHNISDELFDQMQVVSAALQFHRVEAVWSSRCCAR